VTTWKRVIRLVLLSSGCLTGIPVTCHSIFAKSKPAPDDGDYEYVTVVGSMIPQRVRKGDAGTSASAVDSMNAQDFDKMRQRLQNPGKSAAGGP
jgi:hypothetical protein